jgi:hypothetical protein
MNIPIAAAVAVLLDGAAPALAVGLTEADYLFLAGLNVERTGPVLRNLSPREQARLHALINDLTTANDPQARKGDVGKAVQEFMAHQAWELANPGRLWDAVGIKGRPGPR